MTPEERNKAIDNRINEYEKACKEWIKSCTCAGKQKPWECEECTKAFYNKVVSLSMADGYDNVGEYSME